MSLNAPTEVKVGDQVLPISVTSGVLAASGSWVCSLVSASLQLCSSMVSLPPLTSAYCSTR